MRFVVTGNGLSRPRSSGRCSCRRRNTAPPRSCSASRSRILRWRSRCATARADRKPISVTTGGSGPRECRRRSGTRPTARLMWVESAPAAAATPPSLTAESVYWANSPGPIRDGQHAGETPGIGDTEPHQGHRGDIARDQREAVRAGRRDLGLVDHRSQRIGPVVQDVELGPRVQLPGLKSGAACRRVGSGERARVEPIPAARWRCRRPSR